MEIRATEKLDKAFEQLKALGNSRQGQLSEQYYSRVNAQGETVKDGPYYVWQRWVNGKKKSTRVPADQVERIRQDLAQGKKVQVIFNSILELMEKESIRADLELKKSLRARGGA